MELNKLSPVRLSLSLVVVDDAAAGHTQQLLLVACLLEEKGEERSSLPCSVPVHTTRFSIYTQPVIYIYIYISDILHQHLSVVYTHATERRLIGLIASAFFPLPQGLLLLRPDCSDFTWMGIYIVCTIQLAFCFLFSIRLAFFLLFFFHHNSFYYYCSNKKKRTAFFFNFLSSSSSLTLFKTMHHSLQSQCPVTDDHQHSSLSFLSDQAYPYPQAFHQTQHDDHPTMGYP